MQKKKMLKKYAHVCTAISEAIAVIRRAHAIGGAANAPLQPTQMPHHAMRVIYEPSYRAGLSLCPCGGDSLGARKHATQRHLNVVEIQVAEIRYTLDYETQAFAFRSRKLRSLITSVSDNPCCFGTLSQINQSINQRLVFVASFFFFRFLWRTSNGLETERERRNESRQ